MPTNFLNRRMDLIHDSNTISSVVHLDTGITTNVTPYNTLTMDTSYPVKLAGKVIKIFTAITVWQDTDWTLYNSEKEVILTVTKDNIFDFAGRQINISIGNDLPYASEEEVFNAGDYVMVIIDFDEKVMYMCSETNFKKFITGGGDGNLKLFVVDGNTEPTKDDNNFDYKFSESLFKEAAEFEAEEGKNSLVRFDNGEGKGRDKVIYEEPEIIYDEDDNVIGRNMIPVAKIDNIDINCLTAVVNQYMFPYVDEVNPDERGGTTNIHKLMAFMKFNGSMNANFIKEYCYTEAEMLQLPIITTATERIKHNILEEYYNIPEVNRNDYYYVLMALVDADDYSSDRYTNDVRFIPINKSDNTFSSLFQIYNRGFVVNGENVTLPINNNICIGNLIGRYEANDINPYYTVYHYRCDMSFRIANYNNYEENSMNIPSTYGLHDDVVKDEYLPLNPNSAHMNTYVYESREFNTQYRYYLYNNLNEEDVDSDLDSTYDLSWYNGVDGVIDFIEFFNGNLPKDISEPEASRKYRMLMNLIPTYLSSTANKHIIHDSETDTDIKELPMTVVTEYPEKYNSLIKETDYNLSNYSFDDIEGFDRSKVRFKNRVSQSYYDDMAIVYNLFNTKIQNGTITNCKTNELKKCKMCFTDDASEPGTEVNYVFDSNRTLSTVDSSGINYGILMTDYNGQNDNKSILMVSPIKIAMVNKIGTKEDDTTDTSMAEVSLREFMVVKPRNKIVDKNLSSGDPRYPNIRVNSSGNLQIRHSNVSYANLYIVAEADPSEIPDMSVSSNKSMTVGGITYIYNATNSTIFVTINGKSFIYKKANINDVNNFKYPNTDWKGTYIYLYWLRNYSGSSSSDGAVWPVRQSLRRVKYYYRTTDSRNIDTNYDYFTENAVIYKSTVGVSNYGASSTLSSDIEYLEKLNSFSNWNIYLKAYLNYLVETNDSYNGSVINCINDIKESLKLYSGALNSDSIIALTVAAVYGLANTTGNDQTYGITNVKYESDMLDFTCTYNLTVGVDEMIVYPGRDSSGGIYDLNIKLHDVINTNKDTFHKDMVVPLQSGSSNIYTIKTYLEYIKNKAPRHDFGWVKTAVNNYYYYNWYMFDDVNIDGFRAVGYTPSIYEFYKIALTRDMGEKDINKSYFDKVEILDRALFKRECVDNIGLKLDHADGEKKAFFAYYNTEDNINTTISTENGLVLHSNINPKNIYDINRITITDSESNDITDNYVDKVPIWLNHNQTGIRQSYSLSLSDGDPFELTLLPTTGNEGTIETDDIIWKDLLVALSNNKEIDILSTVIKTVKADLNKRFSNEMQNISDTITMDQNKATIDNANTIVDPNSADMFGPTDKYKKYKQPEGTPNAVYNDTYGVYEFYYGYGYTGNRYNRHRILNNRGVIVLVSSDGDSFMQEGPGSVRDDYSDKESVIRPKRMYVSRDGVVCTKDYFDREETAREAENEYTESSIGELLILIKKLQDRVTELEECCDELHQPNISVTKSYSISRNGEVITESPVRIGDTINFTITIKNNGLFPFDLKNKKISDNMSTSTAINLNESYAITVTGEGTNVRLKSNTMNFSNGQCEIEFSSGTITSNASVVLSYSVTAINAGSVNNTSVFEGHTSTIPSITVIPDPELTLSKVLTNTAGGTIDIISPGQPVKFTITIANNSDTPYKLFGKQLIDEITDFTALNNHSIEVPISITRDGVTVDSKFVYKKNEQDRDAASIIFSDSWRDLEKGHPMTITYTITPDKAGNVVNTVYMDDKYAISNSVEVVDPVQPSITKALTKTDWSGRDDGNIIPSVNDEAIYTLTLSNNSTTPIDLTQEGVLVDNITSATALNQNTTAFIDRISGGSNVVLKSNTITFENGIGKIEFNSGSIDSNSEPLEIVYSINIDTDGQVLNTATFSGTSATSEAKDAFGQSRGFGSGREATTKQSIRLGYEISNNITKGYDLIPKRLTRANSAITSGNPSNKSGSLRSMQAVLILRPKTDYRNTLIEILANIFKLIWEASNTEIDEIPTHGSSYTITYNDTSYTFKIDSGGPISTAVNILINESLHTTFHTTWGPSDWGVKPEGLNQTTAKEKIRTLYPNIFTDFFYVFMADTSNGNGINGNTYNTSKDGTYGDTIYEKAEPGDIRFMIYDGTGGHMDVYLGRGSYTDGNIDEDDKPYIFYGGWDPSSNLPN